MSNSKKRSNSHTVKDQARELVDRMPADASWDDLMHQIYVRQAIESGMADSEADRTLNVREVRARFGLWA